MKSYFISALIFLSIIVLLTGNVFINNTLSDETTREYNTAEPADTVGMTNTMKFDADTVRIEAEETVVWKNSSLLAHSVTADPSESTIDGSAELPEGAEPFNSGMMDPEETFSHTFEVPGTYKYFCIPHEGANMYGWIIVEE
ncbi:cupredoxin domain-containing protein [Rhodohalobacter sp. 8-1]|uniref:cupredoxin domain-containing protein n=1 Tax=Rhodohalobacter sp. 8-1 TaxID=3131972 RepID=UPI0030EC963F